MSTSLSSSEFTNRYFVIVKFNYIEILLEWSCKTFVEDFMTKNKGYKGISNGFLSNLMFMSKLNEKVVSSQLIEFNYLRKRTIHK